MPRSQAPEDRGAAVGGGGRRGGRATSAGKPELLGDADGEVRRRGRQETVPCEEIERLPVSSSASSGAFFFFFGVWFEHRGAVGTGRPVHAPKCTLYAPAGIRLRISLRPVARNGGCCVPAALLLLAGGRLFVNVAFLRGLRWPWRFPRKIRTSCFLPLYFLLLRSIRGSSSNAATIYLFYLRMPITEQKYRLTPAIRQKTGEDRRRFIFFFCTTFFLGVTV